MAEFDALISAGWTDAWRSRHPHVTAAEYCHDVRTGGVSDHSALLVDLAGVGAAIGAPKDRCAA
jgi:hypothetical protein